MSDLANKVSSIALEATGFSALTENSDYPTSASSQDETMPTQHSSSPEQKTDEEEKSDIPARDDHSEELSQGPSSTSRQGKPQQSLGTETGIATTAGAGTTLSPDDDVLAAAKKESQNKGAVGMDYSDQPCPTSDAKRDQPTSEPAEGKTQFDSKEEQLNGSKSAPSKEESSSSEVSGSTAATEVSDGGEGGKAGWKDKLKGEAKIVMGKVTRNEEKVEAGRSIKAGGQV